MRRVLAAAVLVAFMPTANAQDKGKADFSANAEFRARYFMMDNPGANEDTLSSQSMSEGRFKVNMGFKASEKVSANFTLLHNTNFGIDNNNDAAGSAGTGTSSTAHPTGTNATINDGDNLAGVNQMYATWMASDDLMFMVGRMNLQLGDGTLIGLNDWQKVPTAWEGLLAGWEQEFGKFWFAGMKVRNLQVNTAAAHPDAANTSSSGDPEHNAYILGFDLKTMPEWMKTFHVHVVKNNADALVGGSGNRLTSTTDGVDTTRYGTNMGFGFGDFDLKAWYENQSGKLVNVAVGGAKTERDYEGNMWAAELGFTAANFMSSRFFLHYHVSSGDDDANAVTPDTALKGYDSFAGEFHNQGGMMDLFAWGNLTKIAVGWTLKTDDKTSLGLVYNMFSRTEASATSQSFTPGLYGGNLPTAANDKDKLGDEIDLWATHNYGGGLSTTLRLGYFMPGDYFKDAATNNTDDKVMHVMIEGKATF